jgi:hypothetical protein
MKFKWKRIEVAAQCSSPKLALDALDSHKNELNKSEILGLLL